MARCMRGVLKEGIRMMKPMKFLFCFVFLVFVASFLIYFLMEEMIFGMTFEGNLG